MTYADPRHFSTVFTHFLRQKTPLKTPLLGQNPSTRPSMEARVFSARMQCAAADVGRHPKRASRGLDRSPRTFFGN
jgi:hypothetical protein